MTAKRTKKTTTKSLVKVIFKYGDIEVPIINSNDELVPTTAINVTLPDQDKKALAIAIKEDLPALLIGEAGTGKTSAVKQLAYLRKQPYVRVNMTGFTTPDELIGSKSVKDGKTYFEHGIITDAMTRGALLVLDEINATSPDCLFILHGLLDEDKRITLPNGEVIRPHKDFRVFATCNPDYEGTKSMNKAFLDRFPIVLTIDVLDPVKEKELIIKRTGIDEALAGQLVTIATMARNDYAEQKIMSYVSTRGLLHIGRLIQAGLEARTAYETTIVKKTSNKEEQKILLDFYLAVMKLASMTEEQQLDMPLVTTKREILAAKQEARTYQEKADNFYREKENERLAKERLIKDLDTYSALSKKDALLIANQTKEIEELKKTLTSYQEVKNILENATKTYQGGQKNKDIVKDFIEEKKGILKEGLPLEEIVLNNNTDPDEIAF